MPVRHQRGAQPFGYADSSATAGGQPIAIPSTADAPQLGRLVFKTELYDYPSLVHVEVFDPNEAPPARILHVSRVP